MSERLPFVVKRIPASPPPGRDRFGLKGYAPLPWKRAVEMSQVLRGVPLIVRLTVSSSPTFDTPFTYTQHEDSADVKGALALAQDHVTQGSAVVARVHGHARYAYSGLGSASWDMGGYEAVDVSRIFYALRYAQSYLPSDLAQDLGVTERALYTLGKWLQKQELVEQTPDGRWQLKGDRTETIRKANVLFDTAR